MSWQGGVAASILGSFSGTLGTQLRISSLTQEGAQKARVRQAFGWTFWLAGQGLGQVAILLAPASLTACVNFSGSLLSNALLAPLVLNEQLTRLHLVSMLLLVLGSGMVTSSSEHADQLYTYAELCDLTWRPSFVSLAIGVAACTVLLIGQAFRKGAVELLSFAYFFALIGAVDLLVTKFTLQLLRVVVVSKTEDAPSEKVVSCFVAMTVFLHVCVFLCQVVAAYYREALLSLPLFLGSGALAQVVVCGTFFDEFGSFVFAQQFFFSGGILLVMAGMLCTSRAATSCQDSLPEATEEEGKPIIDIIDKQTIRPSSLTADSAIITSGLLERSSSSMSSADLLLLGDIQKSALCFGGRYAMAGNLPSKMALRRQFASDNFLVLPLTASQTATEGRLGRAASAPPGTEGRPMCVSPMRRETSEQIPPPSKC